jgi:TrmH family RNA methyltransferase
MHISSLQNDRVKLAYSLQSRTRNRRKEDKIVLEGVRLVRDALLHGTAPAFILYDPAQLDDDFISLITTQAEAFTVTDEIIQHLSDTETPQGVVGVFEMPHPQLPASPQRVLILDAVQQPGNMGTILRTAGAAGVQAVILAPRCVDPYNPKVLRAGMGAHFRLPLVDADWSMIQDYCAGLSVYLAAGDGTRSYSAVNWRTPWALVIGNEAHGIGDNAESLQSERVYIPMAAATESINAAVAAGVILFEAQRQRLR